MHCIEQIISEFVDSVREERHWAPLRLFSDIFARFTNVGLTSLLLYLLTYLGV